MASRARLSPPQEERQEWPWHRANWTSLPASLLFGGDRRMEAENYLSGGYGLRLAMEARRAGWVRLEQIARVTQPGRLKGIIVGPEFGTPYLAATQVFDQRPAPRKYLALERTANADELFVKSGDLLVTRSGSVGRATMATVAHEGLLISDDLLRVASVGARHQGWLYAYLRSAQVRSMMTAAQYGHIIKHLEVDHLAALPMVIVRDSLLESFQRKYQRITSCRNDAHRRTLESEALFERSFGPFSGPTDNGEEGFEVRASDAFFGGRRRFDALPHNPTVRAIRVHLGRHARGFISLKEAGFKAWLPNRFKRIAAEDGVQLLDSSSIYEVNPDTSRRIAEVDFGDAFEGRTKAGWMLLSRSGQIYGLLGTITLATDAYEGMVVSDDVIRIAQGDKALVRPAYAYVALSHPALGRPLVKALAYGSSIPHIDVYDVERLEVPRLDRKQEDAIAEIAEEATALRAKADILEKELAAEAEAIIERFMDGDMRDVVIAP